MAVGLASLWASGPSFSSGKQYHWLKLRGRGSGFFLPSPNADRGEVTADDPCASGREESGCKHEDPDS